LSTSSEVLPIYDAPFHEVYDDRVQADFYGMGAHAEHDGPFVLPRPDHRGCHVLQAPGGEQVRERAEKIVEASALFMGP
jgi:hypothetical protein